MTTIAKDGMDTLPHDTDAEQALDACLMLDSRRYYEVCRQVGPQDFFDPHHRAVFEAISGLMSDGSIDTRPRNDRAPIDVKPLNDRLRAMGKTIRLAEYFSSVGTGWDYLYYARRIADASRRRAIALAAHDLGRNARLANGNAESLLDATIRKASELRVGAGTSAPVRSLRDIIKNDLMPQIDKDAYGTDEDRSLVSTGFGSLDAKLGNLHRGSLAIVAGRPSDGKTSFAANVACWNAVTHHRRVLFISLEQPATEIADMTWRSIANVGPIRQAYDSADRQRRIDRLLAQTDAMGSESFLVWNPNSATVEQIEAVARIQSTSQPLDLVVIDYLQLIRRPREIQGVNYQLEHITQRLKQLAMQLNLPILLLAQLNREAVKDEPQLHHLKDSNVESDADVVLLIWRPNQANRDAKIKVAKNRHGIRDVTLDFRFVGECKRFVDANRNEAIDEFNNR